MMEGLDLSERILLCSAHAIGYLALAKVDLVLADDIYKIKKFSTAV